MDLTKETTESTLDEFSIKLTDYSYGGYGAVSGTFGHDYSNITSSITLPTSQDTITLSNGATGTPWPNTITVSALSNTSIGMGTFANANVNPWTNANPWATSTNSGKLQLNGDNADIEINGVSLVDRLKTIEERLNIMVPNSTMEKEWDQLRELGDQYRALEAKLKEQGDMWTKLKAMPPPEIL